MTTAAGDALRASSIPQPADTPGKTDWFVHDRFGLFIHWGIYAMAARHEWVKQREQITDEDYQPYFDHFDPDLYDPVEWAARGRERRDEVRGHHEQAPRRLLPVGQPIHRLQSPEYPGRARSTPAVGRSVPGRGAEDRLLPLAD